MRKILFLPIERYEERYSDQWYGWFISEFEKAGRDYEVFGDTDNKKIKTGQFLDVFETMEYKSRQIADVVSWLEKNSNTPSVVFFMDLWHPGVVQVDYVRKLARLDVKVKGILHAGTWDDQDLLAQMGCKPTLSQFERSMLSIADEVFVATNFHKSLLRSYSEDSRYRVVDFPLISPRKGVPFYKRERFVTWPHRISVEKDIRAFLEIERIYRSKYERDAEFIATKEVCNSKDEYYDLLCRSKVVVSTAKQETFGIAMLEGLNCGAYPIVPSRLSYPELYPTYCLYDTLEQAANRIAEALDKTENPLHPYEPNTSWIGEV